MSHAIHCDCGETHRVSDHTWQHIQGTGGPHKTVTVGHGDVGAWRAPRLWLRFHGVPDRYQLADTAEANGWLRIA